MCVYVCACCNYQVLVRMKQYKDDLVASCLVLLLSLPTELVEQEVQGLMAALQVMMTAQQ